MLSSYARRCDAYKCVRVLVIFAPQLLQWHSNGDVQTSLIYLSTWEPAGMGKRGHLPPPPSGNDVKCFRASVVTAKRSVGRIMYALFSQPVVGFWAKAPRPPPGLYPWSSWGTFVPVLLICPPLEKILRAPTLKQFVVVLRSSNTKCFICCM